MLQPIRKRVLATGAGVLTSARIEEFQFGTQIEDEASQFRHRVLRRKRDEFRQKLHDNENDCNVIEEKGAKEFIQ